MMSEAAYKLGVVLIILAGFIAVLASLAYAVDFLVTLHRIADALEAAR